MVRSWILAAAVSGALACGAAQAAGSVEAGATKSAVCQGCHGANGVSINPEWPNLAGQGRDYIVQQITNFKAGKRANPIMTPMAMALAAEDVEDVAAYFNSLPSASAETDPALARDGGKIFRGGDAARGIPACEACHGPTGGGAEAAKFPALHGQQSVYVSKQLHDYASGARTTGPGNIMPAIARRLTEDDMRNISAYVQGIR